MKLLKVKLVIVFFILSLGGYQFAIAQEEDEFDEEIDTVEEGYCIPDSLQTVYDIRALKDSSNIRMIYNFGYEYYKNKSYDEALPYLWIVFIKGEEKYARGSIRRISDIYFNQGKVDSTLLACYRGLERYPEVITLHHFAGILQNKLGKFRCAIPHYEKLVAKDSTKVEYLKTLAFLYYKDENEKAIEIQHKVVDLDPKNPEAQNTLAEYYEALMGSGSGLEAYREAYKKDPGNLDFALKYGRAALQAGEYAEAVEPLSKVIAKEPAFKSLSLRAEVYENLSQYGKAIQDYKAILKIEPANVSVMLNMSVNYRMLNNFGSAKYWIFKALKAKPRYGLAYITMGELYEASVSYCQSKSGGKTRFEDKLVYELANKEYSKAKNDPSFRSKAKTKQKYLRPLLPTKEDKFMHKKDKIKDKCYNWIK
jgi:tetratricopeptide (TPR) repeat protein